MDSRDNRQHRAQLVPSYSGAVAQIYSGVDKVDGLQISLRTIVGFSRILSKSCKINLHEFDPNLRFYNKNI